MLLPSFSLSPAAPVLVALSLPAKSTRLSLPTFSPDVWGRNQRTAPVRSLQSNNIAWCILQQESNFIFGVNSCSNPFENGWIWTVPCAKSQPAASETTVKPQMMWSQVVWYLQISQESQEMHIGHTNEVLNHEKFRVVPKEAQAKTWGSQSHLENSLLKFLGFILGFLLFFSDQEWTWWEACYNLHKLSQLQSLLYPYQPPGTWSQLCEYLNL